MTSAPNQAKSCVQVGPDCTWVKSRMRTPCSALPSSPHGLLLILGSPLPLDFALGLGLALVWAPVLAPVLALDLAAALAFAAGLRASLTTLRVAFLAAAFALPLVAFFDFALAIVNLPFFSAHARASGHPVQRCNFALRPRFRGDERLPHFFFTTLCGLRLPMRPDSVPAAGSITALISVGLPESMAASTARLSSSGVVALTPTPPKASMILS